MVDPAFGLSIGWTYTVNWLLVLPTELSAAAVLVSFWSDVNPAGWIAICYVIVVLVNFGGPRVYGEVEYWAAVVKVRPLFVPVFLAQAPLYLRSLLSSTS